jgi:hypothetical protein
MLGSEDGVELDALEDGKVLAGMLVGENVG